MPSVKELEKELADLEQQVKEKHKVSELKRKIREKKKELKSSTPLKKAVGKASTLADNIMGEFEL